MLRRLAALAATLVAASAVVLAPLEAATNVDHAAAAWTILPPGENGSLTFDKSTRDQAALYDALTPLSGNVTARVIRRTFKPAPLGAPAAAGDKRESPRPGVKITRDTFGVAHVTGKTEADVAYGASTFPSSARSSRLDPGAAVMDAAWPRLADAVMSPVLGPLVGRLAALHARSDDANPGGSAYISGWYGYVDKDLRTLLGHEVRGPYSRRYCGAGVLASCREALWGALDAAAAELEKTQGAAPSSWRADATGERIRFTSGVLPDTMRWTNRPTFQQLMSFRSHRPR